MFEEKARAFTGTMPELYEKYLVPLNFAPHAQVVVERVIPLAPRRVLELAAGTGVVTQALVSGLSPDTSIVATDLNDAMLDQARKRAGLDRVIWRQADALNLPFPDAAFDLIVCQFGVMFFPDKPASFREARRTLAPDGTYLFVLWADYHDMPDSPI